MYPSKQKPYSGIFVKNQYEYLKNELNLNIEIYTMKRTFTNRFGSFLKYIKFYLGFFKFLFRKYDIIHIHFFGYHAFLAYLYKLIHSNIKVIVTFHGGDTQNIGNKLFNILIYKLDKYIAVGKEQSDYISKKLKFNNMEIMPSGINEEIFYKEKDKKKYNFIFIGSFYEIKGIDIFIDSIKKLNERELIFCFVGSGKYLDSIKYLNNKFTLEIKENQSQNEIRELLNQSKYLVLPSRGDSFGLVVSEAMFCGTPAIVSNIGGMKDQVEDGVNGFIIKNNTSEELANVLKKAMQLSEDEYDKLAKNAANSNKQYSMKNVCFQLSTIYKELVNEN
jgi:glycosyltransferase involved in cell wall biosynthesis